MEAGEEGKMMPPESHKNGDIQVLRGIAIIFVLLQHYRNRLPTPEFYHGMFTHFAFWGGVDIFFCISGFVITKSLFDSWEDVGRGRISPPEWRAFWLRRAARLLPGAWFWAVVSVLVAPMLSSVVDTDQGDVLKGALAGLFGYANYYWSYCVSAGMIGKGCGSPDLNGVYWSLALEEQFYLVLSVLLLFARLRSVLLLGLFVALVVTVVFQMPAFSLAWVLRPQALVLGIAMYYLTRVFPALTRSTASAGQVLRSVVVIACVTAVAAAPVMLKSLAVPAMALASALMLLAAASGGVWSVWPGGRLLAWIGERSYSIYLCHLIVFLAIREITTRSTGIPAEQLRSIESFAWAFPVALGCAVIVGHLSYDLLERPLARRGRTAASRLLAARVALS